MKEVNIIPDDAKSVESLKQLEQEIKFLSQFKHENIVQYYGSETTEDRFYIYLEYVHPGSINKYISQHCGAMTESVVRNFTRHILKGLAFLHSQKIMHRDIKGANLLVDVNGVVKLADFGMAKHLSTATPNLSLKGTPYWMAPEVVQATLGKDVGYDLAVDIWSLGCTIIEMFTGKPPWSGLEGPAAMFKVLNKDPPIPDNLSSEGKDFLRGCFRRNPAERPTATKLLEHPFIQNSNHFSQNSSTHSLAGIKSPDAGHSVREKKSWKTDTCLRGKQTNTTGETSSSRSPGSLGHRLMAPTSLETHSLSPPPLSYKSSPSSAAHNTPNGMHFSIACPQPSPLPKPNGKETLNMFSY
jgi:serine/threonine protein kinase